MYSKFVLWMTDGERIRWVKYKSHRSPGGGWGLTSLNAGEHYRGRKSVSVARRKALGLSITDTHF